MIFLIEKEAAEGELKYETSILEQVVEDSVIHQCVHVTAPSYRRILTLNSFNNIYDTIVPFGSIKFVEQWMQKYYNVSHINPMEIPPRLRTKRFLKREYNVLTFDMLPETGVWFIKDVSVPKSLIHIGNKTDIPASSDKNHWFQCSEYVEDVKAEYRLYFINGKLENVCNYNGTPIYQIDYDMVMTADHVFKQQKNYPNSYTMDVMVTDKGTSLIELHPFVSVGLYSTMWGQNILNAYVDGIAYLKKYNTPCYPA